MLDLTNDVLFSLTGLGTMGGLAIWIGRKTQQIETALTTLGRLMAVVDEHCRRLERIETHLDDQGVNR